MSLEELEALLKDATQTFREAMDLRGRGRKADARTLLLETAARLYEAAAITGDKRLRDNRKRLARQVLDEAADLPKPVAAAAAVAAPAAGKLPAAGPSPSGE